MQLVGTIEIYGMTLSATIKVTPTKDKGASFVPSLGKWRAQRYVGGKQRFYGYYETKAEALEAYRLKRNLKQEKRTPKRLGQNPSSFSTGVTFDTRARMWRIKMVVAGQRISIGRYASYGHATLVRDVVARRTGKPVVVADYSMPLGLVSDPVARSYITDRILPPTPDELAEYQRRVSILNCTLEGN